MKRKLINHKRPIIIAHQIKKDLLRKTLSLETSVGRRFKNILREFLTL